MRGATTLCAVALISLSPEAAQFRAGAEIVPIYATVRGPDGHLVTDLQQDEFEILDRGKPAPLALFSRDAEPITAAVMVDMSGGVFSGPHYAALRTGLLAFIDRLEPPDRARIGTFGGSEIALGVHLTSDHVELRRVVLEEVWGAGGRRPLWNGIAAAMASLAAEPGRKVVLVLANGPQTSSLPGYPGRRELEAMINADAFMIYGVSLFPRNQPTGPRPVEAWTSGPTLGEMAERTGGGYVEALPDDPYLLTTDDPTERLVAVLSGLVDELRHQYALGFVPTRRDGRIGTIEVRVTRPGLTVSARKTYQAPRE
jgi:Ca-activated chloride channel family protein